MKENEVKLVDKIDEIYKEIKPALIGCAYRYKVPNPQEAANEWLAKAFMIADRFDKGELKKKVNPTKQEGASEDYNSDIHSQDDFIAAFQSYLKTAFVNDIIKQYHKKKRHTNYQKSKTHQAAQVDLTAQPLDELLDAIHLEDIIALVELDISRIEGEKTTILELVNEKFLEAIRDYCYNMRSEYGNFIVVRNLDEKNNQKFFSLDFKEGLADGVRKNLCRTILSTDNPMLIRKLSFLISKDKKGTLQKRLARYFFEYYNGYPKRLKNRVNNGTLK